MPARILAIANRKGGVGKTTTAIHLAATLAIGSRRSLILDLDPQATATRALGFLASGGIPEGQAVGSDGGDRVRKTSDPGVDLVPGGPETSLAGGAAAGTWIASLIAREQAKYDFVFLDCPPSATDLILEAVGCAPEILVPTVCEPYAADGVQSMIELVSTARGAAQKDVGVLITMFDPTQAFAWDVARRIREEMGLRVWRAVIPRDPTVPRAAARGRTVIQEDPCSQAAVGYIELAREVLDHG